MHADHELEDLAEDEEEGGAEEVGCSLLDMLLQPGGGDVPIGRLSPSIRRTRNASRQK